MPVSNSKELRPSRASTMPSAAQEFSNTSSNPKVVISRVHNIPPLPLSWVILIQSVPPHPISLESTLFLSSYLRLGLPSGLSFSGSPSETLYAFLFPQACCMPYLSRSSWLEYSNYVFEEYKLWSSSLSSSLEPPLTWSLFGPNILLCIRFSNSLNLCPSFNDRGQVSQPDKTVLEDIAWYIIIFVFLDIRR
jgi:hypothetical protein